MACISWFACRACRAGSLALVLGLLLPACLPVQAAEVALALSAAGKVVRSEGRAPGPIEALTRFSRGDRLSLDAGSRIQLLFHRNGRLETWTGPGQLELGEDASRAEGMAPPAVRVLLPVVAGQIARTPLAGGKPGGRVRAIATEDALASLDGRYRELRGSADADDLAPEMFLLSGLFEMRQLERVEGVIETLQRERARNPEAALLVALYKRALRNARESKKQ